MPPQVSRNTSLLVTALVAAAFASGACGGETTLPPHPQVLVVVDTNLPVPLAAARLRIDLYRGDGTWFESRDVARDTPRDWPASFGVYGSEGEARDIWVRLRVYPQGFVDVYRGERFRDWSAPLASIRTSDQPRLERDGVDQTPFDEPTPLVTVDRMVLVRIPAHGRGRVRVLLHGACVGTMTKLGAEGKPSLGETETCVDTAKTRSLVEPSPSEDTMDRPTTSAVGTWLREPCGADDPNTPVACVPGGVTMIGTVEGGDNFPTNEAFYGTQPIRIFGVRRFYIDRDEVTVGRVRQAVERGYTGGRPIVNDSALGGISSARDADCTYTSAPKGREELPATCVSYSAARSLCQFWGGDLPSEVEWEHVATVAGHPRKRRYPWGNEHPSCEGTVYDRQALTGVPETGKCAHLPAGPRPFEESGRDVSPLGIRELFGSVTEWVLDDPAEFDAACWLDAPFVSPTCSNQATGAKRHMVRGAGYYGGPARPSQRVALHAASLAGFRCVYPRKP